MHIKLDKLAKISSNNDCTLLYANNVMKIGGTTKEINITSENFTISHTACLDFDKLNNIPIAPKVTPNFNQNLANLDSMEASLIEIQANRRIKTTQEIIVSILTYVGYGSICLVLLYILYKIGLFTLLSKLTPTNICIKIFCQENSVQTNESNTYDNVRYTPKLRRTESTPPFQPPKESSTELALDFQEQVISNNGGVKPDSLILLGVSPWC
ncbi:uncharacterized protein LOC117224051 isoform X1 [Megalopta genalis]|uniref:uncharacterized protein LOC117224051 isoform X1 n=1 Tax=Megalopta genalis TaxID=115081 RepID=UPI003FD45548